MSDELTLLRDENRALSDENQTLKTQVADWQNAFNAVNNLVARSSGTPGATSQEVRALRASLDAANSEIAKLQGDLRNKVQSVESVWDSLKTFAENFGAASETLTKNFPSLQAEDLGGKNPTRPARRVSEGEDIEFTDPRDSDGFQKSALVPYNALPRSSPSSEVLRSRAAQTQGGPASPSASLGASHNIPSFGGATLGPSTFNSGSSGVSQGQRAQSAAGSSLSSLDPGASHDRRPRPVVPSFVSQSFGVSHDPPRTQSLTGPASRIQSRRLSFPSFNMFHPLRGVGKAQSSSSSTSMPKTSLAQSPEASQRYERDPPVQPQAPRSMASVASNLSSFGPMPVPQPEQRSKVPPRKIITVEKRTSPKPISDVTSGSPMARPTPPAPNQDRKGQTAGAKQAQSNSPAPLLGAGAIHNQAARQAIGSGDEGRGSRREHYQSSNKIQKADQRASSGRPPPPSTNTQPNGASVQQPQQTSKGGFYQQQASDQPKNKSSNTYGDSAERASTNLEAGIWEAFHETWRSVTENDGVPVTLPPPIGKRKANASSDSPSQENKKRDASEEVRSAAIHRALPKSVQIDESDRLDERAAKAPRFSSPQKTQAPITQIPPESPVEKTYEPLSSIQALLSMDDTSKNQISKDTSSD